jgi:hypothetical protein
MNAHAEKLRKWLTGSLINCNHEQLWIDINSAAAELARVEAETQDELCWLSEVLTDFRVPFDNHKIGMRVALVLELCDRRKEVEKLKASVQGKQEKVCQDKLL